MPEKKPFHVAGLEPMKMKVLGVNIFPLVAKVAVMIMMMMLMMMIPQALPRCCLCSGSPGGRDHPGPK